MYDKLHDVPDYTRWEKFRLSCWTIITGVYIFVANKITHKRLWREPMWLYTLRELQIMLRSGKSSNDLLKEAKVGDLDPQLRQDLAKYRK